MDSSRRESQMNLTEPVSGGGHRILLVVTVICVIIAVVAVVIACVALASAGKGATVNVQTPKATAAQGGSGGDNYKPAQQPAAAPASGGGRKTYMVADGHDFQAYSYVSKTGYLAGFNHDLVRAVCTAAGLDCRFVWDKYTNCIDSQAGQHNFGGPGLMGKWYDVCTGWYTTVGRTQIFSFSQPYTKSPLSYFFVKKGNTFNAANIRGKKIGFLDGWASDEKCLARQTGMNGVPLPVGQVIHAQTTEELKNMIVDGKVDAGFAAIRDLEVFHTSGVLDRVANAYSCMVAGNAMMTRKDNDFNSYWNMGFQKLMSSGQFRKLCSDAASKHKPGSVECIDS